MSDLSVSRQAPTPPTIVGQNCAGATPTTSQQQQQQLFQAVVDYTAHQDGELSVRAGDLVSAVRSLGNGWSLGRKNSSVSSRDGGPSAGIFPSRCVVPVTSSPSLALAQQQPQHSIVGIGEMTSTQATTTTTPPPREFQDCGIQPFHAQPPQCPECIRCTGGDLNAISSSNNNFQPTAACDITCSSLQLRRTNDVEDSINLPFPSNSCGPACKERPEVRQHVGIAPTSSRQDVECADHRRYQGAAAAVGSGCDGSCGGSGLGTLTGCRGDADQRSSDCLLSKETPESVRRGYTACCRAGVRSDRLHDDGMQPDVTGTPAASTALNCATAACPPPATLRRPAPQPPKPHLIVKPTRDPAGGADSPSPSVLDERLQHHQQQPQNWRLHYHMHNHHRNYRDCDNCADENKDDLDNSDCCQRQAAVKSEDVDEVQPTWCGWRTIGRDRRRAATSSGGRHLGAQSPSTTTTATVPTGHNDGRLSTFVGRSNPNIRDSLPRVPAVSNRHPCTSGDSDDNADQSLSRSLAPTAGRCRHHHRHRQHARQHCADPSVAFRSTNGSPQAPELSFGLSPTRGVRE